MQNGSNRSDYLDDILISVIVPIYNVEVYLPQCIDSLLSQTHPNLEIILVDDGSPDKSGAICDSYAARWNHIRVIHKKNGGLSSARNAGIAAAQGEYIGFVDSDDFVANTMFRTLLEAAVSHNLQVAACGRFTTDEAGTVTGEQFTLPSEKSYSTTEAMQEILISGKLDVAVWDKLFCKELFDGIDFPVGQINEDAAIIFRLLARTDGVVHIGKPMYHYRERGGSITKSGYKSNKLQALEHAQAITEFVCARFPDLAPACSKYTAFLCCQLLSLMLKDPQTRKQYPEHYSRYMAELRKHIRYLYSNPNITRSWKLRGTMIYLHLYEVLYSFLKK